MLLWHSSWHEEEEFGQEGHEEPAPVLKAQTDRRASIGSAASLGKVETESESSAGVSPEQFCFWNTDNTRLTSLRDVDILSLPIRWISMFEHLSGG